MLDLLEHFGWSYFSVVHTDDRYLAMHQHNIALSINSKCYCLYNSTLLLSSKHLSFFRLSTIFYKHVVVLFP